MIDDSTPPPEDSGTPIADFTTQTAETAGIILIPPLGLEVVAKVAEAMAAIKAALAPKARNALANALEKIAQFLRAPDTAPSTPSPPSTTP